MTGPYQAEPRTGLISAVNDVGADGHGSVPGTRTTSGRFIAVGPRQRTALISWAAFTTMFAGTRALTYAIKHDALPGGDLHSGDVHLHHYLWGIKLLAASGGVAIHGPDQLRTNPLVAAGYGAGAALVIDEFALLVHLKDVYWAKRGRMSVVLGASLIAAVGASFAFIPAWRRHLRHAEDRPESTGFA